MSSETPNRQFKLNKKIIKNSIFPISALAVFATTVFYLNNQSYGLALEYQGKTIATVANSEVYEKANHMIINQLSCEDKSIIENADTQLKITAVDKHKCCESASEVRNKIIEGSQDIISEGFGIYINDRLIVAGNNKNEIDLILKNILDEAKLQNSDFDVEFNEKIEIVKGVFLPDEIKSTDEIKKVLTGKTKNTTHYTVLEEDTIVGIAENFGITPQELLKSNKIVNGEIAVGDDLVIETFENVLNTRYYKTINEEIEIPYQTEIKEDPEKEIPFSKVIQGGKNGKEISTFKVEYLNGEEINRVEIEKITIEKVVNEIVVKGTKKPESKSELIWPVPYTKKITSKFGQRGKQFHHGIDIACRGINGQAIIASNSGTVTYVQFGDSGYGNNVIITHGNGVKTRYAHCSSIAVAQGQKVAQGDIIATVGSTGDSTGPHLHFEVIVNGVTRNPQEYV